MKSFMITVFGYARLLSFLFGTRARRSSACLRPSMPAPRRARALLAKALSLARYPGSLASSTVAKVWETLCPQALEASLQLPQTL